MEKNDCVKGFRDFIGDEASKRNKIKEIIEKQFQLYGFESTETPIIESEDFVISDNSNDDAVRDVYRLEDRAKRKLALRYEFTFQLKRLAKNQKLPFKRYQIGYNFRDEPIKKGRLRQFIQCDCDIIGSDIHDEAEILSMASSTMNMLGIKSIIYVNNRKLLNEILVSENIEEKYREQVLRELDKLDKLTKAEVAFNLKPFGAEKLLKLFEEGEKYFLKYKFYKDIQNLKKYCSDYGIDIVFKPTLARGLSYYNGNIFEIWSKEINVSIGGGGSYLINDIQSSGFSFGLEPISLISNILPDNIKYLVVSLGQNKYSIEIASQLRKKGFSTQIMMNKTLSKSLEYANIKNIQNIVFIGEKEMSSKKIKIKNLMSGEESFLNDILSFNPNS